MGFSLSALEQFVMDTIDEIMSSPEMYEPEAVKETVAYRFQLLRKAGRLAALGPCAECDTECCPEPCDKYLQWVEGFR